MPGEDRTQQEDYADALEDRRPDAIAELIDSASWYVSGDDDVPAILWPHGPSADAVDRMVRAYVIGWRGWMRVECDRCDAHVRFVPMDYDPDAVCAAVDYAAADAGSTMLLGCSAWPKAWRDAPANVPAPRADWPACGSPRPPYPGVGDILAGATAIDRGDHCLVIRFARPTDRDDAYRAACAALGVDPYP